MLQCCIEINCIPFIQEDTFIIENNFCLAFEDQEELFSIMIVKGFFLRTLRHSHNKRLHLLVALTERERLVGIAMAGSGDGNDPTDFATISLAHDFVFAIDFFFLEKKTDFDIKEAGDLGEGCDGRRNIVVLNLRDQRGREAGFTGHSLQSQLACLAQFLDFCTDIVFHGRPSNRK